MSIKREGSTGMKRSFILLLAMTMLFSSNVLATKEYANQNTRESLVALGDSIPYGFNLGTDNETPSKDAFPYLIGQDAGIRVPNLAVSGWKTDDMISALESQKYRRAIRNADYITLNIGNNDLLEALFSASILTKIEYTKSFDVHLNEEIDKSKLFPNLQAIIIEIRSLTEAPVIIYNVYNPFQMSNPLHNVASDVLPDINGIFDEYVTLLNATEKDILLADAFHAFGTNQAEYVIDAGYLPDIHPTFAGQRLLADIGLDVLQFYKERETRRQARREAKELFTQISLLNEDNFATRSQVSYKEYVHRKP